MKNLCKDINELEKLGRGLTADIYRLEDGNVLKLFKNKTYEPRKTREYEILKNLTIKENSILMVPKVFEQYQCEGRLGFSMEFIDYPCIFNGNLLKLKKDCRTLAYIISSIEKDVTLTGNYYVVDYMKPIVEEAKIPVHIINYLLKMADDLPKEECVCHCDLHWENIYRVGEEKFMLIDWSESGKASKEAEPAKLLSMLGIHPYPNMKGMKHQYSNLYERMERQINKGLMRTFLKEYETYRKINWELLQKWQMIMDTAMVTIHGKVNQNAYNSIVASYKYFNK